MEDTMTNVAQLFRTARDVYRANRDPALAGGVEFQKFMVANLDPYNLCEDHDDEGCPTPEGMAKAEAFVARAREWGALRWRLYDWQQTGKAVARALHCEFSGHAWVDDSYGGPDSGCMAAHCKRCGWSFHHTLY
jgi:hypothetical protein